MPPQLAAVNVRLTPYRAAGDGKKDDTRPIQAALDAVASKGGGIVFLPAGKYLIKTHLVIPNGTTLMGVARSPQLYQAGVPSTTLLAVEGAGNPEGPPFLQMDGANSTLEGITVFYPDQIISDQPIPYPWTVRGGKQFNVALVNVLLVNPYQAVDLGSQGGSSRHYIRGLYGQPLYKGLWVDKCYDIGRIHDVHFWPFWTTDPKVLSFQIANATAFHFQRTDWEVVDNIFCWQYHIGIELSASKDGAMNGQMSNIGLDAVDIGILARDTQGPGIEFSGLSIANDNNGTHHVAIWGQGGETGAANKVITGKAFLYITGGAFWGYWNRVVKWENGGVIALGQSRFTPFRMAPGPVLELLSGQAMVHDSTFSNYPNTKPFAGVAAMIGPAVEAVNFHDNQLFGFSIDNQGGARATLHDNQSR